MDDPFVMRAREPFGDVDTRALYVDSAYGQTVPKAKPLSRSAGTRRAVASIVCR